MLLLTATALWFALPTSLRDRVAPTAYAAAFTVTNTNDDGPGSLRQAIVTSNLNLGPSANVITFNIPGSTRKITLLSPLPALTSPVTIDGTTQPGFVLDASSSYVDLDGGRAVEGLTIIAGHCTLKGLVLVNFTGFGIKLQANDNNLIDGTFVSTYNGFGPTVDIQIDAGSNNNTLQNSRIGSGVNGVVVASNGNTISGCTISGNLTNGLLITGSNNTIGLPTSFRRNVFQNLGNGIHLQGAGCTGNTIQSNQIGTENPDNEGSNGTGLLISDSANHNLIGGSGPYPTTVNLIDSNHDHGMLITNSNDNTIQGNLINLNFGPGIRVEGSSGTAILNNSIQDNYATGVAVDSGSARTSILSNSIGGSGAHFPFQSPGLGIDLGTVGVTPNDPGDGDAGANNLQNFPVLTNAYGSLTGGAAVTGTLNSTPNSTFRVEFFANFTCDPSGFGEGNGPFGTTLVTTGSDGNASFSLMRNNSSSSLRPGWFVTATATDSLGNTSEFSHCVQTLNAGLLGFESLGYGVSENGGSATVTVTRTDGSSGTATVDYSTSDGTATAGLDYTASSGTITFADGETSKTFTVPILNDSLIEGAETINLTLNNSGGGAGLNLHSTTARLVIFDDDSPPPPIIFGINSGNNHLMSFNSELPERFLSDHAISGLSSLESIRAIAFRPLTGQLYAVAGSGTFSNPGTSRLFTIDITTAVAMAVGQATLPQLNTIHFDPVTDLIRALGANGQNLRLNPDTGEVVSTDTALAFAPGDMFAGQNATVYNLANTNNFPSATTTTTYGFYYQPAGEIAYTYLVTLGSPDGSPFSPNSGKVFTQRYISNGISGLDITDTNQAFATGGDYDHPFGFLKIDLATGPFIRVGSFADDSYVYQIAAQPPQRSVQFSAALYSVNENAGAVTITVGRKGGARGPLSVSYESSDGTATAGLDYATTSGTLNFADGETSKTFTVPLFDDSVIEGAETTNLSLSNASNGTVVGPQNTTTIAIMDEATESGTTPIDNADFFVRQHYADFLNRPPDSGGLTFWTNHITECFNDAACINNRRVGTSAAFFIENEFQQTGFYIYRFYQASLGRRPTFAEFTTDRSQVIGGANLENGKQAFATAFVQRSDFLQKYPLSMDGPTFVDALILNAGQASGIGDLATGRDSLIAQYNLGANQTEGRVRVVRTLIDDGAFSASLYNPAFVLMQYFGYLRRPPDQGGYDFWLNHLNNRNPNNYRAMVCAFITSFEYQHRFSSIITRSNQDCAQ